MLPVISIGSFITGKKNETVGSLFLNKKSHFTSNGRTAIAHVLRSIGVKEGDEVLVPSYHCGSMVEPIIWCKSTPVFYHITAELDNNIDDIESKLTKNTKALIIIHYFGFIKSFDKIKKICQVHNIKIIEDCAHAFFGSSTSYVPGSEGDYAITSLKKFFPCTDGGMIYSKNEKLIQNRTTKPPIKKELSTILNLFESSASYNRLSFLKPLFFLINMTKNIHIVSSTFESTSGQNIKDITGFRWFNPNTYSMEPSTFTKWLITRRWSGSRQYTRRRQNYIQIAQGLSKSIGGQPLHPVLPEGVVPYMFPFLLDDPDPSFFTLKEKGVPLWRWEELAYSDCAISQEYRERLIQIPCHQELTTTEINWMVETIQDVLNRTAEKVQV